MVARCLVGIFVLAGCDKLFGLEEVTARDAPRGEVVLGCPAGYDMQSGVSASRYRHVSTLATWDAAVVDCNGDGDDTHLLVLGDESERIDVIYNQANRR